MNAGHFAQFSDAGHRKSNLTRTIAQQRHEPGGSRPMLPPPESNNISTR